MSRTRDPDGTNLQRKVICSSDRAGYLNIVIQPAFISIRSRVRLRILTVPNVGITGAVSCLKASNATGQAGQMPVFLPVHCPRTRQSNTHNYI